MSDALPVLKFPEFYGGQMGVPGAEPGLGLRFLPGGNAFFVSSTHNDANDGQDGTLPEHPLATIDAAIGKCVANRGDVIFVAPGHTETITTAAAINCDIAGIKIIGLGQGQNRPRINFTNVAATVAIAAANVWIENFLFLVGVDALPIMVDVNADDFHLVNCEFRENTAVAQQWQTAVDINGGGANAADRANIIGCKFFSLAAGANQAIEIGAVQDGIRIEGCWIDGDWANAGIHSGAAFTNSLIASNYIANRQAGDHAIELTAGATGLCIGNRMYGSTLAAILDPGALMCNDNLVTDAVYQAGIQAPATAAGPLPAGSIGAASFENDAITAAVIANDAIDDTSIKADAITNAKIADNALSEEQFDVDAAGKLAYGVVVDRGTSALPQTNVLNLFVVAGGKVLLRSLTGIVTAQIGAVANAIDLLHGATTITGNATDVNGDVVSTLYSITGTFATDVVKTAAGVPVAKQATELVLPPGNIILRCAGSDGGNGRIRWTAVYVPLDVGATLTAI